MSKRMYSSEEALQVLSMTDESTGELSSISESNSESDLEFEIANSSGSEMDSDYSCTLSFIQCILGCNFCYIHATTY